MVRNVSFKTDDELDDKLYSESKKRGITKSALIKLELEKILDDNKNQESKQELNNSNVNMVKEKDEKKNVTNGTVVSTIDLNITELKKEELKPEPIQEQIKQSPLESLKELKTEPKKEEPKQHPNIELNRLNSLVDIKTVNQPTLNNQENKQLNIKKVKRVNDEDKGSSIGLSDEEKFRRYDEKKEFNKKIQHIHDKITTIDDRICKDGECTKNEFNTIKKELSDLKGLKTDLNKIDDLSKNFNSTKTELSDIRKYLEDIKKETPKIEQCPNCGTKSLLYMASHCSECGIEIPEWTEDPTWKPYSKRVRK